MELQQYWQMIQQNICVKCKYGDDVGRCRLSGAQECPLKAFLPEIITTVLNTPFTSYDTYINVLRRHVCILCDWQLSNGMCKKRDELTCALDLYYPEVVEIIKTVRAVLQNAEAGEAIL